MKKIKKIILGLGILGLALFLSVNLVMALEPGEACDSGATGICAGGSQCQSSDDEPYDPTLQCRCKEGECVSSGGEGQPCNLGGTCDIAVPALECDTDSDVCVVTSGGGPPPTLPAGALEPCGPGPDEPKCEDPGYVCDPGLGKCIDPAWKRMGEFCDPDKDTCFGGSCMPTDPEDPLCECAEDPKDPLTPKRFKCQLIAGKSIETGRDCSDPDSLNKADALLCKVMGTLSIIFSLILLLAVLYFVWGVVQYVTAGGDEEKSAKAKTTMMYGVIALAVIVGVAGILRIVTGYAGITGAIRLPFIGG